MRDKKSSVTPSFTFMHLALILFCMVLVTSYATAGLYASYRTEADGSDSARVAKFDVKCSYDKNTKTLTITNDSEVTVEYTVVYSVAGSNLPGGIEIVFEYGNTGTLQPGQTISGILNINGEYQGSTDVNIDVSVDVSQVD